MADLILIYRAAMVFACFPAHVLTGAVLNGPVLPGGLPSFVERNEGISAKLPPFISKYPIGKITASLKHRMTKLYGRTIHFHISSGNLSADRGSDVGWLKVADSELETPRSQRNKAGLPQEGSVSTRRVFPSS